MQEKENDNNKNQSLPHAISTLYEDLQKKILFRQQIIPSFLLSFNSTYSITDTPGTEQPDSKILLSLIRQVDTSIHAITKKLILCKIERELQLFDKLIRHELDECRNHPKDLQFLLDDFAFLENQFTSLLFHRIYSSVKPMTASFCSSSSSACTCSPLSPEVNGSCHEQSVTPSMINDGHLSTVDNVIDLISEEELNALVQQVLLLFAYYYRLLQWQIHRFCCSRIELESLERTVLLVEWHWNQFPLWFEMVYVPLSMFIFLSFSIVSDLFPSRLI